MRAGGGQRSPRPDAAIDDRRVDQPQHRAQPGQHQAGGIDASDGRHGEREQCRVAPAAGAGGPDGQSDHPPQSGPRQQHRRDAGRVVEGVGAQLVGEHGYEQAPAVEAEGAQQVADPEPGREQQSADPQPLRHPVGHAEHLEEPVERPHRPQEADVLVGDGPQGPVGVPQHAGLAKQPARVEVQVGLGVGAHQPRARRQQRQVGDRGGDRHRPARAMPPPGRKPPPPGEGRVAGPRRHRAILALIDAWVGAVPLCGHPMSSDDSRIHPCGTISSRRPAVRASDVIG